MKSPKNILNTSAICGWVPRLVRFFEFRITDVMVCGLLLSLATFLFCLYQAVNQQLVKSQIALKGNPSAAGFIEKHRQTPLLDEPIEIRIEKRMSATTPNYNAAKRMNLTIILKQSEACALHSPETPARAIIIGSGTAIRNVTLGNIMDQLRAVAEPLSDPSDGCAKKEQSNLGGDVHPVSGGYGKDHIHSSTNVKRTCADY